ncbi:MAG TPA: hypothetical protein VHE81_19265, partial [Lacipirellulaceae bacterium]|nr:hypothetical protein [Lacipirellulaceae bacterium]
MSRVVSVVVLDVWKDRRVHIMLTKINNFAATEYTKMLPVHVSKRGRLTIGAAALLTLSMIFGRCPPCAMRAFAASDAKDAITDQRDSLGNRIPDFSNCGYAGADRDIPDVPDRITVTPGGGDDGPRIQAAIERLAAVPVDEHGFHGSVWLAPGRFDVGGQIRITHSGIVLRGSGAGKGGTALVATGKDRRPLVRVEGTANRHFTGDSKHRVMDEYVPVGARRLRLDSIANLKVGDTVLVIRPSTREWIDAIAMNAFGVAWKPGTRDVRWDRVITRIEGNVIVLDAPITTAIERRFGGASVEAYDWPGRISNVGIEDLSLESEYATGHPQDEDHAWFGVTVNDVQNAWVARVEFRHFAGGAVTLWENTKHVTVEDCISLDPISELAGYRRRTFFTQGQLSLFLRCYSANGRHDFAVGHCAAGPNAFVNCRAAEAHGSSGPVESWASGVLYDNVRIDGAALELENRWMAPPGAGWSAANCVVWQCQAAMICAFRPPTANNWAIADWGQFAGDATFANRCDFVRPISLYQSQLRSRRGERAAAPIGLGLVNPISSTNPTLAEAAQFAAQSTHPARQLI